MHVGVFLPVDIRAETGVCLPHARGGVSRILWQTAGSKLSSPCTWGCFFFISNLNCINKVFPMHVGVFLVTIKIFLFRLGLPHARGGVSKSSRWMLLRYLSSPCTWGCFSCCIHSASACRVFPMHVGVFPLLRQRGKNLLSLPHARGGVSSVGQAIGLIGSSSPCTWGCFHKNRLMICFVQSLPHARGGVSGGGTYTAFKLESSPCTWGCFYYDLHGTCCLWVFPMHVGVFLNRIKPIVFNGCLPHARGGVSLPSNLILYSVLSSPCTWGCFCSTD